MQPALSVTEVESEEEEEVCVGGGWRRRGRGGGAFVCECFLCSDINVYVLNLDELRILCIIMV